MSGYKKKRGENFDTSVDMHTHTRTYVCHIVSPVDMLLLFGMQTINIIIENVIAGEFKQKKKENCFNRRRNLSCAKSDKTRGN